MRFSLRSCMVDFSVKMALHWRTSERLTGTDSLQIQVGSHSKCTVFIIIYHHVSKNICREEGKRGTIQWLPSSLSQAPCVTSSGQTHSLRSVTNHPLSYLVYLMRVSTSNTEYNYILDWELVWWLFSLYRAEWPVDQQARSELSVWARCDRTLPGTEQARLHRAQSWGQSWGLRGHSLREVYHRVLSTQLLVRNHRRG